MDTPRPTRHRGVSSGRVAEYPAAGYAEYPPGYAEYPPGFAEDPVHGYADYGEYGDYAEEPLHDYAETYADVGAGPEMVGYGADPLNDGMGGYVRDVPSPFTAGCPLPTNVNGLGAAPLEGYQRPRKVSRPSPHTPTPIRRCRCRKRSVPSGEDRRSPMAVVQGIKEKVHLPIYDCIRIKPKEQLRDAEASSSLRFFLDVQGKTKLETNLQAAGLLPHYNTFEARAMRVVISDLPPEFPDDPTGTTDDMDVKLDDPAGNPRNLLTDPTLATPPGPRFYREGAAAPDPLAPPAPGTPPTSVRIVADIELGLDRLMELLAEAREEGEASLDLDDDGVTLKRRGGPNLTTAETTAATNLGAYITLTASDIEGMIDDFEDEKKMPAKVQLRPNNGAGTLLGNFVYNTVTTFYVGEKIMIQMPTWFFPSGAGPWSVSGKGLTHGEPNPTATFRFAEPIFIEKQQNFRVEIEVPDADTLKEIQRVYGPCFIWVVLDGYMTRNVQ